MEDHTHSARSGDVFAIAVIFLVLLTGMFGLDTKIQQRCDKLEQSVTMLQKRVDALQSSIRRP